MKVTWLAAVAALALAGCGGGGGGSPDKPATAPAPAASYTVGGTLAGLASPGELNIALNGGAVLALGTAGPFRFPASLPSSTSYAVTIAAQPAGQTCTIVNGSGVLGAHVDNVMINCVKTSPVIAQVSIGGTVTGMAASATLTLVNGGNAPVSYSSNGSFSFSNPEGKTYALSVAQQPPGQWCKVTGGAGIATPATTPVAVHCRAAALALMAGIGGGPGDADGPGNNARFTNPMGVVVDSGGNVFVADKGNHVIRKITPAGVVTTFAGAVRQFDNVDGQGGGARFGQPMGIAIDPDDNLYVTDLWFGNVRKITPAGMVTTLSTKLPNQAGAPAGPNGPAGIVRDAAGTLYLAYPNSGVVARHTPDGAVSIVAGQQDVCGHADGPAATATLCMPTGLTLDRSGNLIVIDVAYQLIRKISPAGEVSTLAGMPGQSGGRDGPGATALFGFSKFVDYALPLPGIVAEPSGSVLIADYMNGRVRRIAANGDVSTAAGLGEGYIDGPAAGARFRHPTGLAIGANGDVYVAEDTHDIRRLASGQVTTFAGRPLVADHVDAVGPDARFDNLLGMAVDALGNVYVADSSNSAVRRVSPAGVATTFAGYTRENNPHAATPALDRLISPTSMAIDRAGNLYILDRSSVRKIHPDGKITTLAGAPLDPGFVDGPGGTARFFAPSGIAVDDSGNVFVGDSSKLRKIAPDGTVSTLARNGGCDYRDGLDGRFCSIGGVAVDRTGNVYFSDASLSNIRKLAPDGVMSTVAGNATTSSSNFGNVDGQGTAARFSSPGNMVIDSAGNLYVSDNGNNTVRVVTPSGAVSTLVGTAGKREVHEGPLPARIAGAVVAIGPDDRLYMSSAESVLTIKLD